MGDAQLPGDLGEICRSALIMLGRGARNDLEIRDLGKTSQDFVLNAVGEISIRLFRAQVGKGEHGDRFTLDLRGPSRRCLRNDGRPGMHEAISHQTASHHPREHDEQS